MYDADASQLEDMVAMLIDIQFGWTDRVEELFALGLPDWRGPASSR